MKKRSLIVKLIVVLSFVSCNNEVQFSNGKKLSEYNKTHFIPTLQHQIFKDTNSVYCATLLFAWDEIRKHINSSITISDNYDDLQLLNQSNSYKNVLRNDEYNVSVDVEDELIKARAEFNKSLPFEFKLKSYKNKLTFDGQKVASFGVDGYKIYEQLKIVKILYYKNDENFIVKLLPKDKKHEVILFKSNQVYSTIAEMAEEIDRLTEIGKIEKKNEKINWKYYISEEDKVLIPKINFNIETNYSNLEGNYFYSQHKIFQIKRVWQRTAFALDESGAEIESEADIEVTTDEIEEYEKPKPKSMIFDKPFLILLKRKDSHYPYFGLWTTNTELMILE